MYSKEIRDLLEEKNIETGDKIEVDGRKGRLMPKPESGDPDTLVLKLDSGYNVGLAAKELELLEKSEKQEAQKLEVPYDEEKPDILILHTGGTIASRVSYEEGGVKPAFDPEDLIEMYPELTEECNVHSDVIAQMLSEDMEPAHWQKIAREIDEVKDEYDGIIIGHGTDTMSFTGAALSFMLKGIDTGVMLVGSQRSSDRPSSDAAINLVSAVRFLKNTDFEGVGVCMHRSSNDKICDIMSAAKVRKMHTSRRNAFKPINTGSIGAVDYENNEIKKNYDKSDDTYTPKFEINSNVGFLKVRPGMRPEEIDFLIEQDYDGVVIEGTGLGHMPVNSFDENTEHHEEILKKITKLSEDTLVVMASQCINGRVDMDVYSAGIKIQDAGVIEAKDMHPELAYVKLMWSLANEDSGEKAKDLFLEDFNGEINERLVYNG